MASENEFPTIRDLRDRLSELVDKGLGDHPVQVVIAPASTMNTIARIMGGVTVDERPADGRPPLMIELVNTESRDRLPVTLVSTDYLRGQPDIQ